jgi:hypothetical protein
MVDADTVAYNVAVFLTALFLLEFGADKFIDHTAIVARRTGISETLVGLVTAGGEWEEVRSQLRPISSVIPVCLLTRSVTAHRHYRIPLTQSCVSCDWKYHWVRHFKHPRRVFSGPLVLRQT